MFPETFRRLPDAVQKIVTAGLEEEMRAGFQLLEEARSGGSLSAREIRDIENDILCSSELRATLTGETAAL